MRRTQVLIPPISAVHKSDFDFSWKPNAELCQTGDRSVLQGGKWNNIVESLTINGKLHNILVTKNLVIENNRSYIFGSLQNVSNLQIIKKKGYFDSAKKRFYLGETFRDQYLTIQEYKVFQYVLKGYTAKRIAISLNLSPKTIETYIENIKNKLNCETKNDIITTAIIHGLTFVLFDHQSE